ncbi:MAG: DNA helicase-2/ATP-dependent DNA helicase PcrA [Planctomycetota bacterium]|jgi:DNA helicase-2/ATP-dependent DNA helicase PcrA
MDWMDLQEAGLGSGAGVEKRSSEFASVPGLLESLNEPQRAAVEHTIGPLLILAGPGSGKTRVITSRIAHLITDGGVRPDEILAITFTNKAAKEMRERVERLLPGVKGLWVSTFHAMCARLLRRDIEALGPFTRDFSIYDTQDRNQLLRELIKTAGYDSKRFRPAAVGAWISDWKNRAPDPGELAFDPGGGMEEEVYERVGKLYVERMALSNALDFDDLLLKALELFDKHPGVRDSYALRFRHVMVDEYQDTNRVQYRLAAHLAGGHGNLAVCGDPDQSIYAWRGADVRNILDFEHEFPDPVTVKLEQNYRSTGVILEAATAVIDNNTGRKPLTLWTAGDKGEKIALLHCGDEDEEAREIAAQCRSLSARGESWADMAIFYRANFMQRALESALRLAGVPYQVVGGLEFYARREVKDLVAWLRLLLNPRDNAAFQRVVNSPSRGVGATSMERLRSFANDGGVCLLEATRDPEGLSAIRGRAKKGLLEFSETVARLADFSAGGAGVALDAVIEELDVGRWLSEMDTGDQLVDRETNVEELRAHAHEYDRLHPEGKLSGFLQDVALVSDVDSLADDEERLTLMTLHACKGLEFSYVFIAGCEDELLPHARALMDDPDKGEEEERRLFYVGMTRAKKRLSLTHASTRLVFGESRWQKPSRYLEELPRELVEGLEHEGSEEEILGSYDPADSVVALRVGDRVEHSNFGRGRVQQLTGSGVNARALVEFIHHGSKLLLLQYAGLEKLPS